jgi:hypothetical protein
MDTSADWVRDPVTMSIVIPSYQRRDSLLRLLATIDEALPDGSDTEVVIVLDGSTDGSSEALDQLHLGVELRWHRQPNSGRSAARNAGVAMARGDVCWLVDDDMTVSREAWMAHCEFHAASSEPSVLVGPQWELDADGPPFGFLRDRVERLAGAGSITDPFDFWTGNVSIPRRTLFDVGGFCTQFVGWGEEDVELGFRLLKSGIPIAFDSAAGGHHVRPRPLTQQIRLERERGRNIVRLCEAHTEATRRIIPASAFIVDLHDHNIRSPRIYGAMGRTTALLLRSRRIAASGQRDRLYNIGMSASRLAGVIEAGGSERLQARVTVNHRAFRNGDGAETDQAARGKRVGSAPTGHRTEYATSGMLRQSIALADPHVLSGVRDDASWFAEAVADLNRQGVHRVPYEFTPAIERLACDPALVGVVEDVLGSERWVAWGANIQIGTPNDAFEWHTDIESDFWPTITVVVGIAGCRSGNATRYIPGSHRLPVKPAESGDASDDELVLATATMLDPDCDEIVRFDGFGDGRFSVFDAKGWHCGDTEESVDRLALFLHYQHADHLRIPYMRDFTAGTWFDHAAAFMPNPLIGDAYEHAVHRVAAHRATRSQRVRQLARRAVSRLARRNAPQP